MEPKHLDGALSLARGGARHAGLNLEDTEDCALHFTQKMLTTLLPALNVGAWMRECARHHVVDYVRTHRRRQTHERRWPETVSESGPPTKWDCPDGAPSVEATLLQDELWRLLMAAVAELAPTPQKVFLRHHSGESAEEIAASSDRTPHAVEQSLSRSRKHLRAVLERRGSTEAELRQYLAGDPGPLLRWHSPTPEEL